jgi:hypothetical protein
LLCRHFQRKESHVRAFFFFKGGKGGVKGDIGGKGGLSHGGAAGQDNQVGRVKAAQPLVHISESGGNADHVAVAAVSHFRAFNSLCKSERERLKSFVSLALGSEIKELLLDLLDLVVG